MQKIRRRFKKFLRRFILLIRRFKKLKRRLIFRRYNTTFILLLYL